MIPLDPAYRTLYSELAQRSLDAAFSSEFSIDGRFIRMESRGRRYWYFDGMTSDGGKTRRYVGPVEDDEITRRVDRFKDLKADVRSRRRIVSTLIREAYLPRPDPMAGDVIEALAESGFFRLRGVLVGTVALQTYAGLLGVRLPNATLQTADADFAQFHSISAAVGDEIPPILDILRRVDGTFRDVPHVADGRQTAQFVSRSGFRVEFLTPNRGSADHDGKPASMPALGGAAAEPLRFLDFLIHSPVRAVLLHGAGVPLLVPAPERYAVHKLIVGSRRRMDGDGTGKAYKDRLQARTLMETLTALRQGDALADAYMEAWDRGSAWRDAIARSTESFAEADWIALRQSLGKSIAKLDGDPAGYGLGPA